MSHKPVNQNKEPNIIAKIIFSSRWIQLPIYFGLIIAQIIYSIKFVKMLWHFAVDFNRLDDDAIIIVVLNLIDILMVVNLLVMTIIGGYGIFVSRLNTENHPDQPEWLNHVNASVLKVKLAISIVAISSIHLLQIFMNIEKLPLDTVKWAVLVHLAFVLSAIGVAYTDKILYSTVHKSQ